MLKDRFRKFLPVIVDLETGGFDPQKNAILEIAIQLIEQENSKLMLGELHRYHIEPFDGLKVDKEALEFLKLDLNHPLRNAVEEEYALQESFKIINKHKSKYECSRAILVGHNAHFDSSFLTANQIATEPISPVLTRAASDKLVTKTFPSPIFPVEAA